MKKPNLHRLSALAACLLCGTYFTIPAYAQSSEPQAETTSAETIPVETVTPEEPAVRAVIIIHLDCPICNHLCFFTPIIITCTRRNWYFFFLTIGTLQNLNLKPRRGRHIIDQNTTASCRGAKVGR